MELKRAGTRPIQKGPAEWFTGEVSIEPLSNPPEPSRVGAARVTFQPGARSAWHKHPLGQTLIVTSGVGWHCCDGEPVEGGGIERLRFERPNCVLAISGHEDEQRRLDLQKALDD